MRRNPTPTPDDPRAVRPFETPWGTVRVEATAAGVCRVTLPSSWPPTGAPQRADAGPRAARHAARAEAELRAYLAGRQRRFTVPLDLAAVPPFHRQVLEAARRVPYGRTVTYGALAEAAGRPGAARAVGQAMARNPVPLLVPCHRVVAAAGLGGFGGGPGLKRRLLALERGAAVSRRDSAVEAAAPAR